MSFTDKQLAAVALLLDSLRPDLDARPVFDAGRSALAAAHDLLAEVRRVNALCDRLDAANVEVSARLAAAEEQLASFGLARAER